MPYEYDDNGVPTGQDLTLEQLISTYICAQTTWLGTAAPDGDLLSKGVQFEAMEAAGIALVNYPCSTSTELWRKVSFFLATPELYAMVKEDEWQMGDLLRAFLSSLIARTLTFDTNK